VYALGSTLYELLTGKMPYDHIGSLQALLQAVIQGPPNSIQAIAPVPPPGELVQIAEKAMNRDPKERYSNATALAAAVEAWLDGSKRREQALSVVAQAQLQQSQARLAAKEAEQLKKQAEAILKTIPPWSPEETKWQGWETEDQAAQKVQEAELLKISEEQFLKNALSHFDLLEAHAGLVELYIHQHAAAETARKPHATARLQEHLDRLPLSHPTRQYGLNYLKGLGAISLLTGPEGAEVVLEQYRIQHRRLVAVPVKYLGKTPLSKIPLEPGSWRLHIQAEGYHPLLYPISIRRGEHWDGLAPGERSPRRVKLLPQGTLGSEDCYIPAGWFQAGGDAESIGSLPEQRVWLEAFLMRRFPVTNKEYLDFLNQLVMEGSAEKALLLAPRERTGRADSIEPIYGFDGTRFFLKADQDGDMWEPDLPVCMVDFEAASVYAAWAGWRIPTELEWEKAARGVDGRFFPWGDHFDPSWCHMRESQPGRPHPVGVDSYPVDCSVYEVRGMAGNMGDWTESLYSAEGEEQVVRGGGWGNGARGCRISYRLRYEPGFRSHYLGIRLAKSVLGFE
jgi:serine/threonine-protein kinase